MSKLIAKGFLHGSERTIEVELVNNNLIINEKLLQPIFNHYLDHQEPIGGTYYPPKNTLLAGYNVLNTSFFDIGSKVNIEVIGELETIPSEEGIVY